MGDQRVTTVSVQQMFEAFDVAWRARYRVRYVGFGPKLGARAKALRAAWPELTIAQFAETARRYLADNDPYLVGRRHPFDLLCAANRINQYRVAASSPAEDSTAAFLAALENR